MPYKNKADKAACNRRLYLADRPAKLKASHDHYVANRDVRLRQIADWKSANREKNLGYKRQARVRKREKELKELADKLLAKAAERAASAIRQRALYRGDLNPGRI